MSLWNRVKGIRLYLFWIVLLSLLVIVFVIKFFSWTPPIKNANGHIAENSIADIRSISVNQSEQSICIRGKDRSNPVLLWLHGGPGSSQMPLARSYLSELENYFVVVHWDQRGAGKSNSSSFDDTTMSIDTYVDDAHTVVEYLCSEFGVDSVSIIGHSWGTVIGMNLVYKYPEDVTVYIGCSQVVSHREGQVEALKLLLQNPDEDIQNAVTSWLRSHGSPPYEEHAEYVDWVHFLDALGGGMDVSFSSLLMKTITSTEYSWRDMYQWIQGANRGSGCMWEEYNEIDFLSTIRLVNVPVYFICGEQDLNTPAKLVKQYFMELSAPKKNIYVMKNSSHAPFFKDEREFVSIVLAIQRLAN